MREREERGDEAARSRPRSLGPIAGLRRSAPRSIRFVATSGQRRRRRLSAHDNELVGRRGAQARKKARTKTAAQSCFRRSQVGVAACDTSHSFEPTMVTTTACYRADPSELEPTGGSRHGARRNLRRSTSGERCARRERRTERVNRHNMLLMIRGSLKRESALPRAGLWQERGEDPGGRARLDVLHEPNLRRLPSEHRPRLSAAARCARNPKCAAPSSSLRRTTGTPSFLPFTSATALSGKPTSGTAWETSRLRRRCAR